MSTAHSSSPTTAVQSQQTAQTSTASSSAPTAAVQSQQTAQTSIASSSTPTTAVQSPQTVQTSTASSSTPTTVVQPQQTAQTSTASSSPPTTTDQSPQTPRDLPPAREAGPNGARMDVKGMEGNTLGHLAAALHKRGCDVGGIVKAVMLRSILEDAGLVNRPRHNSKP